jgi:hypothetical protein
MSDFKITPPSLSGILQTGDDVTLSFVWWIAPQATLEAAR